MAGQSGIGIGDWLEARQDTGFGAKLVVAGVREVVEHGLVRRIDFERLVPEIYLPNGTSPHDEDASQRADVASAADLDGAVFGHGVSFEHGSDRMKV